MQHRGSTRVDMDLHNTNLILKSRTLSSGNRIPERKSEQSKIKAKFYLPEEDTPMLIALLNDYPRKGDCFQVEDKAYEIMAITRELLPGTPYMKESYGVDVLIKDAGVPDIKPFRRKYYTKKM